MGCLRLGCAFLVSLFLLVIFTVVLAFLGAFLFSVIFPNSAPITVTLPSPMDTISVDATGALIGGGVGACIGLLCMVGLLRRAADVNWLKSNGQRIIATVTKIDRRTESSQVHTGSGYQSEWQTYYIVVATWQDPRTGLWQTFRSDRQSFYPKKYGPGAGISVLIDPQNPKRYLVEV